MKCPKCAYLGYAHAERCRNCGYEFALSAPDATADLRLHDREQVPQPLDDLELLNAADARRPADRFTDPTPDPRNATAGQNGLAELPLFGDPITDDIPLITKASPPRPPLAVRRATPEVPRLRSEPRAPLLEWPDSAPPVTPPAKRRADNESSPGPARSLTPRRDADTHSSDDDAFEPAGLGARALATVIDVALLAIVDLVVIYLAMKICRLSFAEWALVPKAPLLTFLVMQNGGYFVAFTTTGQTLGKMMAGVRVLADDADHAPDLGRSVTRAMLWLVLAIPAGLGLLTALLNHDRRGLHDRFAGTRVVRAGA